MQEERREDEGTEEVEAHFRRGAEETAEPEGLRGRREDDEDEVEAHKFQGPQEFGVRFKRT
jgi:hypothetical protein